MSARWIGALLLGLVAAPGTVSAQAGPEAKAGDLVAELDRETPGQTLLPVRIASWNAPDSCPGQSVFLGALREELEAAPPTGMVDLSIAVAIEKDGDSFVFRLGIDDGNSAAKKREFRSPICKAAMVAGALTLAMAIESADEVSQEVVTVSPPPSPPTGRQEASIGSSVEVVHRSSMSRPKASLRMGVGTEVGLMPELGGALFIGAAAEVGRWRFDLAAEYWVEQEARTDGIGVSVSLLQVPVRVCRRWASVPLLSSCAGMEVTTTNMGGDADPHCAGDGDGGRLVAMPRTLSCAGPEGATYIRDIPQGGDARLRNYEGGLDEAVACLLQVGTLGCGFEQPLAAAVRATDPSVNPDFMRPAAVLGILFLTDEDDCSAKNDQLFSGCSDGDECPLGALTSFRCFEHGVSCNQPDLREPGLKTGCDADDGSSWLQSPRDMARTIRSRRSSAGHVVIGFVAPPSGPIRVEAGTGSPTSGPRVDVACASELGTASPAPRLDAFASAFAGQSSFGSICEDMNASLQRFGELLRDAVVARPCLRGKLLDTSAAEGIQPDCNVFDVSRYGSAGSGWVSLEPCAEGRLPCYELETSPECAHLESGLAVRAYREFELDSENVTVVECQLDE